jgi:solute:Na+ symporter, SSS family
VVQAIIKTMGALLILGLLLYKIEIGKVIEVGLENNKFSLGTFKPNFFESSFWVVFVYGFFINLTNFGIDQNYIQRYHTAQSTSDASKSIWLCVIYYLPLSFLFFFIGTALFVYYNSFPEEILALKQQVAFEKDIAITNLQAADYGDRVLPLFIKNHIPTGLLGLLMAALLSAAMSTMSSSMNSSATVFLKDIFLRFFRPNATEKAQMAVLRIATVSFGIIGIVFGLAMIGAKSLLDVWWKLSGIFAGGMLGIFLLGYLVKKANNWNAKIALIMGVLVIGWMSFSSYLPSAYQSPFDSKMTVVLGTLTILGVGFFLSFKKK